MNKKTVVQFLKESLDLEMRLGTKMVVNWDMYLQMERQQMEEAVSNGISKADMTNHRGYFDFDKWYNETYGGNK